MTTNRAGRQTNFGAHGQFIFVILVSILLVHLAVIATRGWCRATQVPVALEEGVLHSIDYDRVRYGLPLTGEVIE